MLKALVEQRRLAWQLARREVVGRYRGSLLGIAWSFLTPLLMLAVYTFVFSEIFNARWGERATGKGSFAIVMFAGMVVHGLLAEVMVRSPTLVVANANYVKKIVFPLSVLPVSAVLSASVHMAVSLLILIGAVLMTRGMLPPTVLWLPVVLLPLVLLALGIGWMLASLGVYLRDVSQGAAIVATMLLFLSPVLYPLDALPESMRGWVAANPLTFVIEQVRAVVLWGESPEWNGFGLHCVLALAAAWFGFAWFERTKVGFADVL